MGESTNRLFIEGRLTADPEIKATGAGVHFAKFNISNSEFDGEKYNASFFDCVAFGELGESIYRKLKRGSIVFIAGKIKQYRWTDRNGEKHEKINIVVMECTESTGALETIAVAAGSNADEEGYYITP